MEDPEEFSYPGFPSPVRFGPHSVPAWHTSDSDRSSPREGEAASRAGLGSGLSSIASGSSAAPEAPSSEESPHQSPGMADSFNMGGNSEQEVEREFVTDTPPSGTATPDTPAQGGEPARGMAVGQAAGVAAAEGGGSRAGPGPEEPRPASDDGFLYECNVCHRAFAKSQALGGHMNTHRKEMRQAKLEERQAKMEERRAALLTQGRPHSSPALPGPSVVAPAPPAALLVQPVPRGLAVYLPHSPVQGPLAPADTSPVKCLRQVAGSPLRTPPVSPRLISPLLAQTYRRSLAAVSGGAPAPALAPTAVPAAVPAAAAALACATAAATEPAGPRPISPTVRCLPLSGPLGTAGVPTVLSAPTVAHSAAIPRELLGLPSPGKAPMPASTHAPPLVSPWRAAPSSPRLGALPTDVARLARGLLQQGTAGAGPSGRASAPVSPHSALDPSAAFQRFVEEGSLEEETGALHLEESPQAAQAQSQRTAQQKAKHLVAKQLMAMQQQALQQGVHQTPAHTQQQAQQQQQQQQQPAQYLQQQHPVGHKQQPFGQRQHTPLGFAPAQVAPDPPADAMQLDPPPDSPTLLEGSRRGSGTAGVPRPLHPLSATDQLQHLLRHEGVRSLAQEASARAATSATGPGAPAGALAGAPPRQHRVPPPDEGGTGGVPSPLARLLALLVEAARLNPLGSIAGAPNRQAAEHLGAAQEAGSALGQGEGSVEGLPGEATMGAPGAAGAAVGAPGGAGDAGGGGAGAAMGVPGAQGQWQALALEDATGRSPTQGAGLQWEAEQDSPTARPVPGWPAQGPTSSLLQALLQPAGMPVHPGKPSEPRRGWGRVSDLSQSQGPGHNRHNNRSGPMYGNGEKAGVRGGERSGERGGDRAGERGGERAGERGGERGGERELPPEERLRRASGSLERPRPSLGSPLLWQKRRIIPAVGSLLMAPRTLPQRMLAQQNGSPQSRQPQGVPLAPLRSPTGRQTIHPQLMDTRGTGVQAMSLHAMPSQPMPPQPMPPQASGLQNMAAQASAQQNMEVQWAEHRGLEQALWAQQGAFPPRMGLSTQQRREGGGEGSMRAGQEADRMMVGEEGGEVGGEEEGEQDSRGAQGVGQHGAPLQRQRQKQMQLPLKRKLEFAQRELMQNARQLNGQRAEEMPIEGAAGAAENPFTAAPEGLGQGQTSRQELGSTEYFCEVSPEELGLGGAGGNLCKAAPAEESVPELEEVRSEAGDESIQVLGRHLEFLDRQQSRLDKERHRLLGLLWQQQLSQSRRAQGENQGQLEGQGQGQGQGERQVKGKDKGQDVGHHLGQGEGQDEGEEPAQLGWDVLASDP